ncbi:ABC transporter ATP-binding protein [Spongiactinospora sp. TRM90649]|uniref:ABC transporter ATP-binding protein n=1 Tax=Spongiactinospora sp. TRM90649 TaxID=3031114 RepID=UPI0023F97992|nr:ABC transporter ATP-binding protein [Spongiactinospora sp. TRM90649]MDF5755616.1 ABC transporter ATP-binding protein [Spongiactinospora sp. TRM90649]
MPASSLLRARLGLGRRLGRLLPASSLLRAGLVVTRTGEGRRFNRRPSPTPFDDQGADAREAAEAEEQTPIAPMVSIRETVARFWPVTRGLRKLIVLGVAFAAVAAACEVAAIGLFGMITDQVLASGNLGAFWLPAAGWVGLALVGALVSFTGSYATALAGERFLFRLRDRLFRHMQTLTPDYFDNRRLGDLMARLTNDIEAIEQLLASGLVRLFTTLVSVVFFAGAALVLRWDLALVTLALVPAFLLVSKGFAGRFRVAAARERRANGEMNSVIEESLANQSLVQAYNRQENEAGRLNRQGRRWMIANLSQARLSALYGPSVQILETLCVLVVIGVGAWEIAAGRLTIGGLLAFAAYLAYLYPAVQSIGELALTVSEAAAGSDRVMEVLRTEPAVKDRETVTVEPASDPVTAVPPVPVPARGRGEIAFEGVTFGYPNRPRPTLSELSFRAGPGDLILCTGASGAGKSTIAKLLLRFYDPTAGRITLDGRDIRELPHRELRDNITILQQENLLFSGTVRDNIAYGRPGCEMDEIVQAAVLADVHDFIGTLPQKYDTPIGQRGRLLSGGQRQRIAIARAILRDAPVLILDEPMTGLDATTAARIMEPLGRLMSGRTTIFITHDPRHVPGPAREIALPPPVDEEAMMPTPK